MQDKKIQYVASSGVCMMNMAAEAQSTNVSNECQNTDSTSRINTTNLSQIPITLQDIHD